jgi:hypothetical protein
MFLSMIIKVNLIFINTAYYNDLLRKQHRNLVPYSFYLFHDVNLCC